MYEAVLCGSVNKEQMLQAGMVKLILMVVNERSIVSIPTVRPSGQPAKWTALEISSNKTNECVLLLCAASSHSFVKSEPMGIAVDDDVVLFWDIEPVGHTLTPSMVVTICT